MTPRTGVTVSREKCRIGDNIFFLISACYSALKKDGRTDLTDEMQKRIDKEADSPESVLAIVQEYVTLT